MNDPEEGPHRGEGHPPAQTPLPDGERGARHALRQEVRPGAFRPDVLMVMSREPGFALQVAGSRMTGAGTTKGSRLLHLFRVGPVFRRAGRRMPAHGVCPQPHQGREGGVVLPVTEIPEPFRAFRDFLVEAGSIWRRSTRFPCSVHAPDDVGEEVGDRQDVNLCRSPLERNGVRHDHLSQRAVDALVGREHWVVMAVRCFAPRDMSMSAAMQIVPAAS